MIGFTWRSPGLSPPDLRPGTPIRIRIWSSVPNDLQGVVFGLIQTLERPNISDADYEAHLRVGQEEDVAEELRRREPDEADARRPQVPLRPPPDDPRMVRIRAQIELQRLEEERRELEAQRERLEKEQREAEARAEAARRRAAYCDAHHEDTGCWGPGGFEVYIDLKRRADERRDYCAEHTQEARCWTTDIWYERKRQWSGRIAAAQAAREAPPEPEGPPPAPRAETEPPKPSRNAEWRPGYWHWNGGDWSWIVGQWRVPESDIEQQLTAQAPSQPPAPEVETAPPPPATVAVWTPGYWSWDGSGWLWVAGSWQIPPAGRVEWRPSRWEARGSIIVLVPGAWIGVP